VNYTHLTAMADFAFRLKEQLVYVNEHSFNNFQIRAGDSTVAAILIDPQGRPASNLGWTHVVLG
jgi:hypothetical protein